MALNPSEREHVVSMAVEILSHRRRARMLEILRRRLADGDYPDGDERDLDQIAYAVARAVSDELDGDPQ